MRGLLRFLLYVSLAVALVWTWSVAYQRITAPAAGKLPSTASRADAMRSAMWAP